MPQRADKMTNGPRGKKPGPGDLRHPAGAQHARLKRENTAKLPEGVTGVILGGKPGTHTVGGKKVVQITQKQMDALHAAKRSEEADRRLKPGGPRSYKEPAWARNQDRPKPHEVKKPEERKAGDFGMSARKLTREMTKDEKAAELTRLMKKGYRKGYRVGKRPTKPRNPFRSSSRKSSGR